MQWGRVGLTPGVEVTPNGVQWGDPGTPGGGVRKDWVIGKFGSWVIWKPTAEAPPPQQAKTGLAGDPGAVPHDLGPAPVWPIANCYLPIALFIRETF